MDVSHFTSQSMCKINVVAFLSPPKSYCGCHSGTEYKLITKTKEDYRTKETQVSSEPRKKMEEQVVFFDITCPGERSLHWTKRSLV